MASRTFFASWELWQQMTFVLAMGIALVFLIGLVKLWWTNRHMERIEQLDAEKQERTPQIHRPGLSADTRRSRLEREIPFGVKAIESGAEADGVWVVRMVSMATRPPDRKWTSSRKVSGRAGGIAKKESLKHSAQPGKKPESPPPREAQLRPNDSEADRRLQDSIACEEDIAGQSQPGHAGPLGRIQRSLKKMASSELWVQQQSKRGGGQEAREFRNNAEARKPQRFYPQVAASAAPRRGISSNESVPGRKSSLYSISNNNSAGAAKCGPTAVRSTQQSRPAATTSRSHHLRKASWVSSTSSVESFATSVEELKGFVPGPQSQPQPQPQPPPLEHHPVFSSSDLTAASELTFGRRRSHHLPSAHEGQARHSSSEDGSSMHEQQQHDAAIRSSAATALRYPPNSSRSANYIQQPRPQSNASDQQPRPGAGACFAAQPSPTFGPSDTYINTSARKVNANFEILPAGTFGLPEQHGLGEPASTAAGVRSSFDSQGSVRKKLQKQRTSRSYSR
ncbi:hypothetical protein KVR01_011141 [Diaporthe batatas]|uniref:uncharacterized protein n=1 Tax=Diaporthe batatas TaxID=748121 RepID=UPI001D03D98D|nr:uncharacterized protein KVR01_011141 [Diaporthe batatas]KAG8159480.1 hypothetical protein KVR01_011141 [Diaporthe batatas]